MSVCDIVCRRNIVGADAALSAVTRFFKNLDLRIFSLASLVMSIQNVFRLAQHSLCGYYS